RDSSSSCSCVLLISAGCVIGSRQPLENAGAGYRRRRGANLVAVFCPQPRKRRANDRRLPVSQLEDLDPAAVDLTRREYTSREEKAQSGRQSVILIFGYRHGRDSAVWCPPQPSTSVCPCPGGGLVHVPACWGP